MNTGRKKQAKVQSIHVRLVDNIVQDVACNHDRNRSTSSALFVGLDESGTLYSSLTAFILSRSQSVGAWATSVIQRLRHSSECFVNISDYGPNPHASQ